MFTRIVALGLIAASASTFTGCCCGPMNHSCGPQLGCGPIAGGLPVRLASRAANRIVSPCADGCGEVYWGERINHPPVLDPCGCDTACRPILSRLSDLWGRPYMGACECAGSGCSSCDAAPMMDGEVTFASAPSHSSQGSHCASCMAAQQSQIPTVHEHHDAAPNAIHSHHGTPTPAARQPAPNHVEPNHHAPAPAAQPAPVPVHDDHHASTQTKRRIRPVSTTRPTTR